MAGRRQSAVRRRGTFDAFDLARRQATLAGKVDVATLPRAADRLVEGARRDATVVSWRITGRVEAVGSPTLEIRLDGSVPLECQRCLQAFAWPMAQVTTLLLARDEREVALLDDGDDAHEVILASEPQDALTLIEDEVLLALPFAPRCERPECAGHPVQSRDPNATRPSAFAALAGLKNDEGGKTKR
jgi:uncharacterized protein